MQNKHHFELSVMFFGGSAKHFIHKTFHEEKAARGELAYWRDFHNEFKTSIIVVLSKLTEKGHETIELLDAA